MVVKTEDGLRLSLELNGNIGNVPLAGYACDISASLSWLTYVSQRTRPVKGRIRDHKEFWGLSPNVSFEHCNVNPVSGPFDFVPRERPWLRVHPNRDHQGCKCSGSTWNLHIYPPK